MYMLSRGIFRKVVLRRKIVIREEGLVPCRDNLLEQPALMPCVEVGCLAVIVGLDPAVCFVLVRPRGRIGHPRKLMFSAVLDYDGRRLSFVPSRNKSRPAFRFKNAGLFFRVLAGDECNTNFLQRLAYLSLSGLTRQSVSCLSARVPNSRFCIFNSQFPFPSGSFSPRARRRLFAKQARFASRRKSFSLRPRSPARQDVSD